MKGMTSSPPKRAPVPCAEMHPVREKIDALDRELVALLAQRQSLIEQAGRIKPTRDTVRDEARIEEVITHVLHEAGKQGLSPKIAEQLWRLLIELSIAHEYDIYDKRD